MKKITAIMVMLFIIGGLRSVSQESNPGNVKKKQKFCSAKITMLDKSVEKYALGGFADDSIIVFLIQRLNKHTKIQVERETRIAATSIKKIAIRIEKARNSPGIYSYDSINKQGANDSIVLALKKIKSGEVVDNTISSLILPSDPFSAVLGLMQLSVLNTIFLLMSKQKVYHIKGKQERFDLMKENLTVKKSKSKKAFNTKNQIL
jgi:hypothetical protein